MRLVSTQLDKWLKNLDGLASLPEDEIDARIEALKAEQESIRLKLAVLQQLRPARSKARADLRATAPQGASAAELPPQPPQQRSYDWKRRAVLELIQSQPGKTWSASEVRGTLIANGTMAKEEGTNTRVLLRRLAERGEIEKVGTAAYTSNISATPNGHGDSQQAFAGQGANQE